MSNSSRASGLDRSSSMAFAFFNRRHSSSIGLRRSVSSVSSRRHSSPISQSESLSDSEDTNGPTASRFPRSLRWRLLARKVLGNVDEEPSENGEFLTAFKDDEADDGLHLSLIPILLAFSLCTVHCRALHAFSCLWTVHHKRHTTDL